MIPKIMNEYQIVATTDYAGICTETWRKIAHYLKTFQDLDGLKFASKEKVHNLGDAHVKLNPKMFTTTKKSRVRPERQ